MTRRAALPAAERAARPQRTLVEQIEHTDEINRTYALEGSQYRPELREIMAKAGWVYSATIGAWVPRPPRLPIKIMTKKVREKNKKNRVYKLEKSQDRPEIRETAHAHGWRLAGGVWVPDKNRTWRK